MTAYWTFILCAITGLAVAPALWSIEKHLRRLASAHERIATAMERNGSIAVAPVATTETKQ